VEARHDRRQRDRPHAFAVVECGHVDRSLAETVVGAARLELHLPGARRREPERHAAVGVDARILSVQHVRRGRPGIVGGLLRRRESVDRDRYEQTEQAHP
jgi:hypothetical protein